MGFLFAMGVIGGIVLGVLILASKGVEGALENRRGRQPPGYLLTPGDRDPGVVAYRLNEGRRE